MPSSDSSFCFIKQNEERGCAARGEEISCFATPLAREEFAGELFILGAKENQAAPKETFGFHAPITNMRLM